MSVRLNYSMRILSFLFISVTVPIISISQKIQYFETRAFSNTSSTKTEFRREYTLAEDHVQIKNFTRDTLNSDFKIWGDANQKVCEDFIR